MAEGGSLVCTAGPCAGRTFGLSANEVVIGRSSRCGIVIADPGVSRRHLALRRSPSGWAVEDLGSGNGTTLNGQPLRQATTLSDGDVLSLASTRFSFRAGARRRLATELRSRFRGRRLAVLLLVPALALGWVCLRAHQAAVAKSEEARRAKEAAAYAFQRGKKLVRQGDWRQAQLTFEALQAQAPELPGLQDYIERGKKEIENQNLLERATAALEEDELGAAAEALGSVSPDTQLRSQLQQVRALLEQHSVAQMNEARRALGERDYPRALEIAEDVLAALPKNGEAESLAERARRAAAARPKPLAQGRLARMRNAAAQRFRVGDLKGAISVAEECAVKASEPCRRLLGQLREIAALLGRAEQLNLAGLERLLELDVRAGGGHASSLVVPAEARPAADPARAATRATERSGPPAGRAIASALHAPAFARARRATAGSR